MKTDNTFVASNAMHVCLHNGFLKLRGVEAGSANGLTKDVQWNTYRVVSRIQRVYEYLQVGFFDQIVLDLGVLAHEQDNPSTHDLKAMVAAVAPPACQMRRL